MFTQHMAGQKSIGGTKVQIQINIGRHTDVHMHPLVTFKC